jgi:hypothetical protein
MKDSGEERRERERLRERERERERVGEGGRERKREYILRSQVDFKEEMVFELVLERMKSINH